jgi:16S rRNA (cytidine1402-2'-O)-methyltransferase
MPGTLFVVATPIGNLEDITMRALRILRESAVIAAEDTRRTRNLLARYDIATPTTSLHEHNEASKAASILARLERGENVALVSDAGTPTVADPGQALVAAALSAGFRVEPIPGPNAAIATLAVSGFPAESFVFLGFPPVRSKDRALWFDEAKKHASVVIFYEAPHRIRATLEELQRQVGDIDVVVGRELTKAHEELVKGQISSVLERITEPKGEFTVVANFVNRPNMAPAIRVDPPALLAEFGLMTENKAMTRRQIIAALSLKHQLPQNQVYRMLEAAKK